MNNCILMGRLTKDPEKKEVKEGLSVARYTLAVDRQGKEAGAAFIPCVAFGKTAEFANKYFHKGMRVLVKGHIQTGSYTNKEGNKVYTTELAIESQEFADSSNKASIEPATTATTSAKSDDFVDYSEEDVELPFN